MGYLGLLAYIRWLLEGGEDRKPFCERLIGWIDNVAESIAEHVRDCGFFESNPLFRGQ